MWRAQFIILSKRPTQRRLDSLADGYHLYREAKTGLFFLTPGGGLLRERPDFSEGFARESTRKADFPPLAAFLSEARERLAIQKHEVNWNLFEHACSMSTQLGLPVLVSEEDDDEFAMAVMADQEAVEYLRFRTMRIDGTPAEVVYKSGLGFTIEEVPPHAARGVTDAALEELLPIADINVRNFSEPKPSRAEARRYARQLSIPVDTYLDSFGVFEPVRSARPQARRSERMMIPLRYAGSALVLPFVIVGMVLFAVFKSRAGKAGNDAGLAHLFLIGFAATVGPIIALIFFLGR